MENAFINVSLGNLNFLDLCYYKEIDGAGGEFTSPYLVFLNCIFETENKRQIYNFVKLEKTGPEYLQIFSDDDAVLQNRISFYVTDRERWAENHYELEYQVVQRKPQNSVNATGIFGVSGRYMFSG